MLLLSLIGIHDAPPPPGTPFEELDGMSLGRAWRSGAVVPVTYRGLLGTLLADLSASTRGVVGEMLVHASHVNFEEDPQGALNLLRELAEMQVQELDAVPNRAMVSVNVQAPSRIIEQEIKEWVRDLKNDLEIPERRRRDDKAEEYLRAWDLREGWTGEGYDVTRETRLVEVAQERRLPISTASNHYKSAFRQIVGEDYSPELWTKLFGYFKLANCADPEQLVRRGWNRPGRTRQRRAIPVSTVCSRQDGSTDQQLSTFGASECEIAFVDLQLDVQDLINRKWKDERIASELEIPLDDLRPILDHYRSRQQDSL